MFGEKSFEFIKDVERQLSSSASGVPTYDENGIRLVFDEINGLYDQNQKAMAEFHANTEADALIPPPPPPTNEEEEEAQKKTKEAKEKRDAGQMMGIHLRHAALDRNKDCVLAYMSARLERIRELRWIKGSVLPDCDQANMTEHETKYFSDYNKMLANYMRAIGVDGDYDGLDLTEHMEPPKSHMVYFRVLQDYGEFEPEEGKTIVLQKQCVHNLPRYQIAGLLRQGVIEILSE